MTITKKDLQILQREIKALHKKMDRLIVLASKSATGQSAKKATAKSAKAKSAKTKPTKPMATEHVLRIIKRSKKGLDAATLVEKTGFDLKKVRNILFRTYKQGKIKRAGKGIYVGG